MTLKEKIEAAVRKMDAVVKKAETEKRSLTDAEKAEFEALSNEVENLKLEQARQQENERITQISAICRSVGMSDKELISDTSVTVEQAREKALNYLIEKGSPVAVKVTVDSTDKFRAAASDALFVRCGGTAEKYADGYKDFKAYDLKALASECLSRDSGKNITEFMRMSPSELFDTLNQREFFNPTASFPAILDSVINKKIVEVYKKVPTTFERITTKGTLTDFKKTTEHNYLMGGAGELLKIPENGEFKADMPRTELLPERQLDTYGREFSMSRQAFINDDIGFITEVPAQYATAMKKTINKQVYSLLYENPVIYDGKTLFCDDHKNLISTGAKPSQSDIQSMILKLMLQTDPFGDAINILPGAIVAPVGYEFDLKVIFGSANVTGSSNNDINPLYNNNLGNNIVSDATLNVLAAENACPWFLFADSASSKGIQVDYLDGNDMPTIVRIDDPGRGYRWRIFGDWGITVIDYRGIVKNAGVKL